MANRKTILAVVFGLLAVLQGCNVKQISINEQLMQAASSGDLATAKLVLDQGADVNTKSEFDNTPLYYAVANSHIDVVRELIQRKADVNVVDVSGDSILSVARDKEIIRLLKKAGAQYKPGSKP